MKHYKQHSFLLFCLLTILTIACCKEPTENDPESDFPDNLDELGLPPATTTGENTMGFLINDEPWLPLKTNFLGGLDYHIPFSYLYSGSLNGPGYLSLQGVQDYDTLNTIFTLSASNILYEGIYTLQNFGISGKLVDSGLSNNFIGYDYRMDTTYVENEIIITKLDTVQNIISGTFNFRVTDLGDTLYITEGRFDLKGN